MTTKTIPTYLEDERRKRPDAELRMVEAARIQPLHHSHHRKAKLAKLELPSPDVAPANARKIAAAARKKPRVVRKTTTKARKVA